jgi:hypothetical protein
MLVDLARRLTGPTFLVVEAVDLLVLAKAQSTQTTAAMALTVRQTVSLEQR